MRVFVTMLGFNRPEMIEGALDNFAKTTNDFEHRFLIKTLFDPGYPLHNPQENAKALKALAIKHGWWYTPIPNEGVMGNHNRVIHDFYRMEKDDYYIVFDPDVRMQQVGWINAMLGALQSDDATVFVCASRPYHREDWCSRQHGETITTLPDGVRISRYKQLIAWSMGMWKGEFLASRPRDFKADNPIYGYAEHADVRRMTQLGKTWCAVTDFYDHHKGAEPLLVQWKKESAEHKTRLPFETWVRGRV